MNTKQLIHVKDLTDQYDLFLFDIDGTVLTGSGDPNAVAITTTVIESINQLIAANKYVKFVSNSRVPRTRILEIFHDLGMNNVIQLQDIVTPHSVFEVAVADTLPPKPEYSVFYLSGNSSYYPAHDVLKLVESRDIHSADILYLDDHFRQQAFNDYFHILSEAAQRKILILSGDFDVTFNLDTKTIVNPTTTFASMCRKYGARVINTHKPHNRIFELTINSIPFLESDKMIIIGDRIDLDIMGGYFVNIHSGFTLLTGDAATLLRMDQDLDEMSKLQHAQKLLGGSLLEPTHYVYL